MSDNVCSPKRCCEDVAVGKVTQEFLMRVEKYQQTKFERVGLFDLALLRELVERIDEEDIGGEVEILATSKNKMRDDTTCGLIVVKYNGDRYMALAGLTDHE